jgi:3-dehydroquinate dehydratase-2
MKLLILNGPNLNLLGRRRPEIYGTMTLTELEQEVAASVQPAIDAGELELFFFQTNHEGQLIDTIQNAERSYHGIVYNPAAHSHYSIALRDAVEATPVPVVEVHLSNITQREEFRHHSVIAEVCIAQFMGEGATSYKKALAHLITYLKEEQ